LPPFEMTREGRDWKAEKEQIEAIETIEQRLALWSKIRHALTVARLHGGAALIAGVRAGGSMDPSKPLDVTRVGKDGLRYLIVASRHQLSAPQGMEQDPESDFYGQPAMYQLQGKNSRVNIHPSRVFPFHGKSLPPGMASLSAWDSFWGDPLLVSIKSALDNAETVQAAVATLLHEMKQDVISIPGLTELIGTEESEGLIAARVEAVGRFKSMFNTLLLDGGDEDGNGKEEWETRQLSFAQHPELLRSFLGIVGGAADIPVTRLMGESPGGMNSTGKGEQDDFDRMIGSQQGAEISPQLLRFDEILLRSALGTRPPEIVWEFAPLRPVDETQASENEKREAETVTQYASSNLIPSVALAKAVQNRMIEGGRWPGLDKALEEAEAAGKLPPKVAGEDDNGGTPEPVAVPPAANDDEVQAKAETMAKRGTITRDQAISLIADASPRSCYVRRDLLNTGEFLAWAKRVGFETTEAAGDLHVTIAYSRVAIDWMKAGSEGWGSNDDGSLTIAPGGPRIVDTLGDAGAVVLLFAAPRLSWRHEEIAREAGASNDYDEYQPHVTITYQKPEGLDLRTVEPFRGALRFGPEIFEEVK
jgi:phage-related protein (TIGR01555 family)